MNRKKDELIPIEVNILEAGVELLRRGRREFYGYLLAQQMQGMKLIALLPAQTTLYRALDRLTARGLLARRREEQAIADLESRPPRWYYQVTGEGIKALSAIERRQAIGRQQSAGVRA